MSSFDPTVLPDDLPVPEDDGRADHITGLRLPSVELRSTSSEGLDLSSLPGRTVVYLYPKTGRPGVEMPDGWDGIPGARGCTPQSCSFRDHHSDLLSLGASAVFGLSTQSPDYQREAKERLHLPFDLLSDENLELRDALELPILEVEGETLLRRMTLVLRDGEIERVFYPVFPPDRSAEEVIQYLAG